jgi:hypothetical protein
VNTESGKCGYLGDMNGPGCDPDVGDTPSVPEPMTPEGEGPYREVNYGMGNADVFGPGLGELGVSSGNTNELSVGTLNTAWHSRDAEVSALKAERDGYIKALAEIAEFVCPHDYPEDCACHEDMREIADAALSPAPSPGEVK